MNPNTISLPSWARPNKHTFLLVGSHAERHQKNPEKKDTGLKYIA
jgi:hypothetical protein